MSKSQKRIRVEFGKYQVGDTIYDRKISGFGRFWFENAVEPDELKGQVWEECRCGREPIYISHDLCESCAGKFHGTRKKFCYAYLEDEPVKNPSIFTE